MDFTLKVTVTLTQAIAVAVTDTVEVPPEDQVPPPLVHRGRHQYPNGWIGGVGRDVVPPLRAQHTKCWFSNRSARIERASAIECCKAYVPRIKCGGILRLPVQIEQYVALCDPTASESILKIHAMSLQQNQCRVRQQRQEAENGKRAE